MQIETCRKVENVLKRFDRRGTLVQVLPFHAAVAQESRLANMNEFINTCQDKVCQFLVCTDRYLCYLTHYFLMLLIFCFLSPIDEAGYFRFYV